MNRLHRAIAPISDDAWQEIDDEAIQTLKLTLSARKLVDVAGPHGWEFSAIPLGHSTPVKSSPADAVEMRARALQPLVELRAKFELPMEQLATIDRGAPDADLDAVATAARQIALAENRLVFHGSKAARIAGIIDAAEHTVALADAPENFPGVVAQAAQALRSAGVSGPYAVALNPEYFVELSEATSGGYPVMKHVTRELDGPVIAAPGLDGGVMLSIRGGDFELSLGGDLSIGYLQHDADKVMLYLEESLAFRVLAPEAAVALMPPQSKAKPR